MSHPDIIPPPNMPALFIGHGNPMNAIENSICSEAWAEMASSIPRPKAILCISAHWETEGTFVTAMEQPKTIHDFYGFPDELFQVQYPAPGSRDLAERVRSLVTMTDVQLDDDSWGIDHGAWSVLCRMYPKADIPVVQLSLDHTKPPRFHYELAKELLPLRQEGVLIIGSGNIVHNLRLLNWRAREPHPWAVEFDRMAAELILAGAHERLIDYQALGEAARLSIPTPEHYLPLLSILALQQPNEQVSFFAEGVPLGSLSMRSVWVS